MTPEQRREHLRRIAPLGGRARAEKLPPERRRQIAAEGFAAMVTRYFAGDRRAAIDWLVARQLFVNDPCPWQGYYRDPGPFPRPVEETAQDARHEPETAHQDDDQDEPGTARHEPATAQDEPEELPF